MVTWSLETLQLALYVIAIICSLYIPFVVYQYTKSWWMTLFFLLMPAAFWLLSRYTGPFIAGGVVLGAQIYFIRKVWKMVGRVFVYVVICWAGIAAIGIRKNGWIPGESALASLTEPTVEQAAAPEHVVESYVPVDGGRIWYKRSGSGSGMPVILVHGGPGMGSYYLKPLEALGDDRPVVRYDQLGAGASDKVNDSTLFTIEHFVGELDSLRATLGYEKVHLVGHSWGTILAFEYYRAHPTRVASLTLAGAALNVPEWARHARSLVATLSPNAQQVIKDREASGDFDAPDYSEAVNEFYGKYVFLRPNHSELDSTMKTMNRAIYLRMWGPSEFTVTGSLKDYNATRLLRRVRVPTLFTVGEFDEANPETVKRLGALVPGAKVEVVPDAAHITTWDNPDVTIDVTRQFLRTVDSTVAAAAASATAGKGGT
jgi:proline iminopeptidase